MSNIITSMQVDSIDYQTGAGRTQSSRLRALGRYGADLRTASNCVRSHPQNILYIEQPLLVSQCSSPSDLEAGVPKISCTDVNESRSQNVGPSWL
jgi:hypothetical protein